MEAFGSETKCNAQGLSELLTYWGMVGERALAEKWCSPRDKQMVGLEVADVQNASPSEPLPIAVPADDVALDPDQTGTKVPGVKRKKKLQLVQSGCVPD